MDVDEIIIIIICMAIDWDFCHNIWELFAS